MSESVSRVPDDAHRQAGPEDSASVKTEMVIVLKVDIVKNLLPLPTLACTAQIFNRLFPSFDSLWDRFRFQSRWSKGLQSLHCTSHRQAIFLYEATQSRSMQPQL